MRELLAQVLLSLLLFGGVWLLGQVLAPQMGITGYIIAIIIFSVLGYYLNGMITGRLSRTARAPSGISSPAYSAPRQRIYSPSQQMYTPPQPTRTRYTPERVRGMLQSIEERYNAGEIDRVRYEQLLQELVFQDAYGRWWTIDHRTGRWVQNKDGTWVESEPPPWLEK